jgi:hypothetical protein
LDRRILFSKIEMCKAADGEPLPRHGAVVGGSSFCIAAGAKCPCHLAGSHLAVVSPFGAACTCIIAWPLIYQQRGEERAVLGGFDLTARKFMKTDELTFSVPLPLYRKMLEVMENSALTRHTWETVKKKVNKSAKTWEGDKI